MGGAGAAREVHGPHRVVRPVQCIAAVEYKSIGRLRIQDVGNVERKFDSTLTAAELQACAMQSSALRRPCLLSQPRKSFGPLPGTKLAAKVGWLHLILYGSVSLEHQRLPRSAGQRLHRRHEKAAGQQARSCGGHPSCSWCSRRAAAHSASASTSTALTGRPRSLAYSRYQATSGAGMRTDWGGTLCRSACVSGVMKEPGGRR